MCIYFVTLIFSFHSIFSLAITTRLLFSDHNTMSGLYLIEATSKGKTPLRSGCIISFKSITLDTIPWIVSSDLTPTYSPSLWKCIFVKSYWLTSSCLSGLATTSSCTLLNSSSTWLWCHIHILSPKQLVRALVMYFRVPTLSKWKFISL